MKLRFVLMVMMLCRTFAFSETITRTAGSFLDIVEMNKQDVLEYTLANGQQRTLVLTDCGMLNSTQEVGWSLWIEGTVDGAPFHHVYSPFSMKALYEPWVINGMRMGINTVKGMAKELKVADSGGLTGKRMHKDVCLWVNDASLPIVPNCSLWFPLFQDHTPESPKWLQWKDYTIRQDRDIHPMSNGKTMSTSAKTGWLGRWNYGVHEGVDVQLPVGVDLYCVVDNATHLGNVDNTDAHRIWYGVSGNGHQWWLGNSHTRKQVGAAGDSLNSGDVYALAGTTGAGTPHAHAWLKLGGQAGSNAPGEFLNPWPIMWQGLENKKEADGVIRAQISPVGPAQAGQAILFSSAESHTGSGNAKLSTLWIFDDGTTSEQATVKHAFSESGLHQAILLVSDESHNRDLDEVFFSVGRSPTVRSPWITVEIFSTPTLPSINMEVSFSLKAEAPNNNPITISWDFGDGTTAMGEAVTHSYAKGGRHYVIATVTDTVTGRKRLNWYRVDMKEARLD